ncbi:uncharacterized protein [Rutidosis leptorrhynchoides]|uniref:uncharacterized protein n=1 Tax=Rutidosis leptorrhynchoides TaxID=125765 RepID=UPI003A9933D4
MTSTTTTTATVTTITGTATAMDRRTYWCHDCDMSISLIPTTTTTTTSCPHCTSNFLEELDSPTSRNNPYFNRVMNHLLNSDHTNINQFATGTTPGNLGVSNTVIEGINSVKVTSASLEIDPVLICAICKDQFVIDDVTKELPCKHMYHPDCIIPWLKFRNSCPVCRFQMPVEPVVDSELNVRRRSRSRSSMFLRLLDSNDNDYINDNDGGGGDDDEDELLGFGFRNFVRRHQITSSAIRYNHSLGERDEVLFSPSQIGEVVEMGDSGRTDSVETVSSWPNWPVDGGEIVVSGASVNDDDADVVML